MNWARRRAAREMGGGGREGEGMAEGVDGQVDATGTTMRRQTSCQKTQLQVIRQ